MASFVVILARAVVTLNTCIIHFSANAATANNIPYWYHNGFVCNASLGWVWQEPSRPEGGGKCEGMEAMPTA